MSCDICERLAVAETGADPFVVARLTTGTVKLMSTQYFRGYTLFLASACVREVYDLPADVRRAHLHEMAEVTHAVARAFQPRKMNCEALGNGTPHLHWHLIPRYATDPHPNGPVWEDLAFLRVLWLGAGEPTASERDDMRAALRRELQRSDVEIVRDYVSA
jgi:diadenosine tetraphosphate (Ap4A) HIT family hydrolase